MINELQYMLTEVDFETASNEWRRNKNKVDHGAYKYKNNAFGEVAMATDYEVDDEYHEESEREPHESLMDRIKALGVNDQKALKPYDFDEENVEYVERIKAKKMPKTDEGLLERENKLNAKFVEATQQEYKRMRKLTQASGELISNGGMIRDNDGIQRARTLKEQKK
jgi:hypothetical protein